MRTIRLTDKASSPYNTELSLIVDEEEQGVERWREYRAPKLPPRRTQGALTVSEQDPLIDFTWSQDDWSAGALRPYYREGDRRYALSKGVDARWEGVLALGMEQQPYMDWIIRGSGAEQTDDVAKWSTLNGTLTRTTTDGEFKLMGGTTSTNSWSKAGFKFVASTSSSLGYVYQDVPGSVATPAIWQSNGGDRTIKVGVNIKAGTLASGFTPMIGINDGQTTSWSSAHTSTSFGVVTVSHTVASDATRVRVLIGDGSNTTSGTSTFFFDEVTVQVGTVAADEVNAGMASHDGNLYTAQGQVVAKWSENLDVWEAVHIHASTDATDIVHFDDRIYVAFGYDQAYIYGTVTSWTTSTISGATKAKFFAVARNSAGSYSLWKAETANTIKSSTNPVNGGSWASAYTIGSADRTITRLFSAFDTLLIGKEDGLWQYNRVYQGTSTAENAFAPISTEWDKGVDIRNFSVGAEWHGYFYSTASSQSVIRWTPGRVEDITSILLSPRVTGYGGEVKAMSTSPHELWVAADIPESAEAGYFGQDFPLTIGGVSGKRIKLMSLRQDAAGQFNLHTIDEATFGDIHQLSVWTDPTGDKPQDRDRYLVAAGIIQDDSVDGDIPRFYRWVIPHRSAAPFIDAQARLNTDGQFDTSIWHGGVPGTPKAFLKAVFWVKNLGGAESQSITVKYGLDGEDSETYTLGTLSTTSSIQTLYFNDAEDSDGDAIDPKTQAVGRAIQMRFDFNTDSGNAADDNPRMFAFEVHSTLRPPKLKTWEVFVRLGQNEMLETGYHNPVAKTAQLTALDTLEDQNWPIYFKHTYDGLAGFDEESNITVQIVDRERVSIGDEYEVHRIILQEADTSA